MDTICQEISNSLKPKPNNLASWSDCGLDFIGNQDRFLLNSRAVLINFSLKVRILHSLLKAQQICSIWGNLFKIVDNFSIFNNGDGAKTVIKVWEQIRDSVVVLELGKHDRLIEGIVEAIQVNKIDSILVRIVNFSNLACSWGK